MAPRPTLADLVDRHDLPGYYADRGSNAPVTESVLDKVRVALAWRLDRGRDIYHTARSVQETTALPTLAGLDVLDIGCGNGDLVESLLQAGARVVGVEPSPGGITKTRSRGGEVYPGTAEDFPRELEGRTFDLVVMQHVLEHVVDVHATVARVAKSLRPGGLYLCDVPNNTCTSLDRAGPTWYWLDAPRHINCFTRQSLEGLVASAGLRVERTLHYGYTRQVAPAWMRAERLAMEHQMRQGNQPNPRPDKATPSSWVAWQIFIATAFAAPHRRYDSLRLVARKA
jgi:SAM-dependent methyltransferase